MANPENIKPNEDEAWVMAHTEKPIRDAARTDGVPEDIKESWEMNAEFMSEEILRFKKELPNLSKEELKVILQKNKDNQSYHQRMIERRQEGIIRSPEHTEENKIAIKRNQALIESFEIKSEIIREELERRDKK